MGDYLDLVDVSRQLGLSYSRVWSRVTSGAIPATRTTSGWRVRKEDLASIQDRFGQPGTGSASAGGVKSGSDTK